MSLSSLSIKRPVLAIVMAIVIILFGFIGYTYLGVREYPSVDAPIITVSTAYTGANAEVIESQITEPLEESINGIAGIRSLTSVSSEGRSSITVEFSLDVDLETAANDVRDRAARAVRNLPPDADPPVVAKADADASSIFMLTLKSDTRNLLELSDFANNVFKERLQTIPGVSTVQIWGEKKPSMRLWLDPAKLAAYDLTAMDVRNALNRENIELPSGRIEGANTELTVRTLSRLQTVDDFNDMIIKDYGNNPVRLKDVGEAALGPENERSILKRDGVPMVGIGVVPQPGSNQIDIVDRIYQELAKIQKDLPGDIKTQIGFDNTSYIRKSITEVEETVYIALGLVILIIFAFLRDWRTTLIPIVAIPVSLIGAFFIMYLMNFSINVLTLLGIVLAIGLVVDDAIVVLENIYSKVEQGMPPREAGMKGSAEIFFAIISTTITLAAVFLPIIFLQGMTGRLFREFGIVVAGSVLISAFVALTLTPMLSTKILKPRQGHNWFYRKTEPFFVWLSNAYKNALDRFMAKRWLAFIIMAVSAAVIVVIGGSLQSELAPLEDRSQLRISSTMPEGTSYEAMDSYMDQLTKFVQDTVKGTQTLLSITAPGYGGAGSVNSGMIFLVLKDRDERPKSQQQIFEDLSGSFRKFNAARTIAMQAQTIGGSRGGLPVQYVLQAPNSEKLREALPKFFQAANQDPTFSVVDVNLKFNKPELVVSIDRDRARSLGVSAVDIAQTLSLALSGQRFGYFYMNGKQYQVIGQVKRADRSEPLNLKSLFVKNSNGELIQLDNLVSLKEQINSPQLYRFNRYTAATISANLAPGKTIGDGIKAMDAIAKRVLDPSFSTALNGPSKDFAESSSSLVFTFMLALVLIYLILAAQFESFRDPLIIMFTVPLALAGALMSLWYFNHTMNIFSEIGMIMLIGLVTKNGILIVEFANQRRSQGLSLLDAVKDASVSRFRPIIMTSLATILGTLPIALALGSGAGSRVSMGVAVIGGLIFSTFLTLFVVPAIYSYLSPKGEVLSNVTDDFAGSGRKDKVEDEFVTK
ncbi:MAG TPA: efflux RND transporter permease subunit [Ignavibacteriales bacterium]|nr:efflux RND transporter permease subunit [Ignavibacteriales bacterium]